MRSADCMRGRLEGTGTDAPILFLTFPLSVGARHEIEVQGFPHQPLVTVAMEGVEFREPVFVGDTLSFWTNTRRAGETSITMHVTVETERDGKSRLVTQADVTYVAVSLQADGRRPVPIRGKKES